MTTLEIAQPPTLAAPERTSGLRRWASVLAMVVGPWGFVVVNLCYLLAIRDGGSDSTGAEALALYAAHPTLVHLAVLAGPLACILIVPAVLGWFRIAARSRAVVVGGSMMIAGYICYFAVLNSSFPILAMALDPGPHGDYARVIDAAQADPWGLWIFAIFALGNIVGTAILAVGLLLGRVVPIWAALAIGSWPVLHVIGLVFFGNEVPQVIGAVLQALGFAAGAVVRARQ